MISNTIENALNQIKTYYDKPDFAKQYGAGSFCLNTSRIIYLLNELKKEAILVEKTIGKNYWREL